MLTLVSTSLREDLMKHTLTIKWTKKITNSPGGRPRVVVATEGGDTRWTAPGFRGSDAALALKPGQRVEVSTNREGFITSIRTI